MTRIFGEDMADRPAGDRSYRPAARPRGSRDPEGQMMSPGEWPWIPACAGMSGEYGTRRPIGNRIEDQCFRYTHTRAGGILVQMRSDASDLTRSSRRGMGE